MSGDAPRTNPAMCETPTVGVDVCGRDRPCPVHEPDAAPRSPSARLPIGATVLARGTVRQFDESDGAYRVEFAACEGICEQDVWVPGRDVQPAEPRMGQPKDAATHEAELYDAEMRAHTEGWNEAIEEAAKACEVTMPTTMGVGGTGGVENRTWQEPNPYAAACAAAVRKLGTPRTGGVKTQGTERADARSETAECTNAGSVDPSRAVADPPAGRPERPESKSAALLTANPKFDDEAEARAAADYHRMGCGAEDMRLRVLRLLHDARADERRRMADAKAEGKKNT